MATEKRERDGGSSAQPPRSDAPSDAVLGPATRVRDTASGQVSTARAWLAARAAQGRDPDEASDELINAIARGDLHLVDDSLALGRAQLSDDVEAGGP